jgi:hypothetical protein
VEKSFCWLLSHWTDCKHVLLKWQISPYLL